MFADDKIEWSEVEEAALALLCLTLDGGRAWKNLDWDLMDRLYQRGWIFDPKNRAKSVAVTEAGAAKAREVFRSRFLKNK